MLVKLLKVTGQSLMPEVQEGDFVLASKIPFFLSPPKAGDLVVFRHPAYGIMIKRVQQILPQGERIVVSGTHPASIDSRTFGPIHTRTILGKVIWHIPKPSL